MKTRTCKRISQVSPHQSKTWIDRSIFWTDAWPPELPPYPDEMTQYASAVACLVIYALDLSSRIRACSGAAAVYDGFIFC